LIIIRKVEDDEKQVVSLRETLMNQGHREGHAKEFSNILHAQLVTKDMVHEGKVILVDLELAEECSLICLFAGLVIKLYQESDLRKRILSFLCWNFSV
jgi:hypothetical protein